MKKYLRIIIPAALMSFCVLRTKNPLAAAGLSMAALYTGFRDEKLNKFLKEG